MNQEFEEEQKVDSWGTFSKSKDNASPIQQTPDQFKHLSFYPKSLAEERELQQHLQPESSTHSPELDDLGLNFNGNRTFLLSNQAKVQQKRLKGQNDLLQSLLQQQNANSSASQSELWPVKSQAIVKEAAFLDKEELEQRFRIVNKNVIQEQAEEIWMQKDKEMSKQRLLIDQINKNNDNILIIREPNELERLDKKMDNYPCLSLRKWLIKTRIQIVQLSEAIIKTTIFEAIVLTIILLNSIVLALQDREQETKFFDYCEIVFTFLYTVEFVLKVCGLGFLLNKYAYLKDIWNIFDFVILMLMLLNFFNVEMGLQSVNSVRSFRILRPLSNLYFIPEVKIVIDSITESIPQLRLAFISLLFLYIVVGTVSIQFLTGRLKQHCFDVSSGISLEQYCRIDEDCASGQICAKQVADPHFNVSNFNNLFYAIIIMFQCTIHEGWTQVYSIASETSGDLVILLFIPCALVFGFFFKPIFLAIIYQHFCTTFEYMRSHQQKIELKKFLKDQFKDFTHEKPEQDDQQSQKKVEEGAGLNFKKFIIAKRAAKQMILFLRTRQAKKRQMISLKRRKNLQLESNLLQEILIAFQNNLDLQQNEESKSEKQSSNTSSEAEEASVENVKENIEVGEIEEEGKEKENEESKNTFAVDYVSSEKGSLKEIQEITLVQKNISSTLQMNEPEIRENPYSSKNIYLNQPIQNKNLSVHNYSSRRNIQDQMTQSNMSYQQRMINQNSQIQTIVNTVNRGRSVQKSNKANTQIKVDYNFQFIKPQKRKFRRPKQSLSQRQTAMNRYKLPFARNTLNSNRIFSNQNLLEGSQPKLLTLESIQQEDDHYGPNDSAISSISGSQARDHLYGSVLRINTPNRFNSPQYQRKQFFKTTDQEEMKLQDEYVNKLEFKRYKRSLSKKKSPKKITELNIQENLSYGKVVSPLKTQFKDSSQEPKLKHMQSLLVQKRIKSLMQDADKVININPKAQYFSSSHEDVLESQAQEKKTEENNQLAKGKVHNKPFCSCLGQFYKPFEIRSKYSLSKEQREMDQFKSEKVIIKEEQPFETISLVNYYKCINYSKIKAQTEKTNAIPLHGINIILSQLYNNQTLTRQGTYFSPQRSFVSEILNSDNFMIEPEIRQSKEKFKNQTMIISPLQKFKSQKTTKKAKTQNLEKKQTLLRRPTLKNANDLIAGRFYKTKRKESIKPKKAQADPKMQERRKKEDKEYEQYLQEAKQQEDIILENEKNEVDFQLKHEVMITNTKTRIQWSGGDVLNRTITFSKEQEVIRSLNYLIVWPKSKRKWLTVMNYHFKGFIKSQIFNLFILICLIANAVVLGIQRFSMSEKAERNLNYLNFVFGCVFSLEVLSKSCVIGFERYFSDVLNALDLFVVAVIQVESILFLAEFIDPDNPFTIFRSLRILKLIQFLKITPYINKHFYIRLVRGVLQRNYKIFLFQAALLTAFIYIFALIGYSLIGRNDLDIDLQYGNAEFSSFTKSIYSVFQIMTLEGWDSMLYDTVQYGDMNRYFVIAFFFSGGVILNFVLLNVFNASILNSFLNEDKNIKEKDKDQQEKEAQMKTLILRDLRMLSQSKKDKEQILSQQSQDSSMNNDLFQKGSNKDRHFGKAKYIKHDNSVQSLTDLDQDELLYLLNSKPFNQQTPENFMNLYEVYFSIECQVSLYVFPKNNAFRFYCMKMVKKLLLDRVILIVTSITCFRLILASYLSKILDSEQLEMFIFYIDVISLVFFLLELIIKVIGCGLLMDKGSYLRDYWSYLDISILIVMFIDCANGDETLAYLVSIKLIKIFRYIRGKGFQNLNLVLRTIEESVLLILQAILVLMVIIYIFSIMGVALFNGKMSYCSKSPYFLSTQIDCEKKDGIWLAYTNNFDNVIEASSSLLVVTSLENWDRILYQAIEANGQGLGPQSFSNMGNGLFFVVFISVVSLFFQKFVSGVMFIKLKEVQAQMIKEEKQVSGYNDQEYQWIQVQQELLRTNASFSYKIVRLNLRFQTLYRIVNSYAYQIFKLFMIIICTALISSKNDITSDFEGNFKSYSYTIFAAYFLLDYTLSISNLKLVELKSKYCLINAALICVYFILLWIEKENDKNFESLKASILLMKVFDIIYLPSIHESLMFNQNILILKESFKKALPYFIQVMITALIIFTIYGIIGSYLFKDITQGLIINETNISFNDFGRALIVLFSISTMEDWNQVMADCLNKEACRLGSDCETKFTKLYFISFILIFNYILLNLFVLVFVSIFVTESTDAKGTSNNPLSLVKYFQKQWHLFSQNNDKIKRNYWSETEGAEQKPSKLKQFFLLPKGRGQTKLKQSDLINFLKFLGEPLGMPSHYTLKQSQLFVVLLDLVADDQDMISFHELLFKTMKKQFGNFKLGKSLQQVEIKTIYDMFLKNLELDQDPLLKNSGEYLTSILVERQYQSYRYVNHFTSQVAFRRSFGEWKKHYKLEQKEQILSKQLKNANISPDQIRQVLQNQEEKNTVSTIVNVEVEQEFLITDSSSSDGNSSEEDQLQVKEFDKEKGTVIPNLDDSFHKTNTTYYEFNQSADQFVNTREYQGLKIKTKGDEKSKMSTIAMMVQEYGLQE